MLIDSHVYVWDEPSDPRATGMDSQDWIPGSFRARRRTVRFDEVTDEMVGAGVTGAVLVQCTNTLRHTEELLAAARAAPLETKVVGWVPLQDPAGTFSALEHYSAAPELAGVRHRLLDQESPDLFHSGAVAESLEMVADAGLVLNMLPWPKQVLQHVPAIADEHPHLKIVIDLLGWPEIESQQMQPWTDYLAAAADAATVSVKVGGFYRMAGAQTDPHAWRPYVSTAVELFGPDRIMIGSDWPTINVFGYRYQDTMNATLAAFSDLTPAEQAQVQHATAAEVYSFAE